MMTRNQQYSSDQKIESEIGKFMDTYFYSKIQKAKAVPFTRHSDTQHQFAGVDVTLGKIKIDEKAKVYGLLNKILGYPSFELQIINRGGQIDDGWFMKDGMQTTHYCFIAVFTSATKEKDITFENITKLNALFINKAELVKYIYSLTPKDTLKDDIEWLRDGPEDRTNYSHRMFHLKRSSALAECPINLVMKRENILKLSGTCEIEITPQGITKL